MLYDDQPGFSLVSNGAEIILIDKKFYLENCPQSLLTRLRREVTDVFVLFCFEQISVNVECIFIVRGMISELKSNH